MFPAEHCPPRAPHGLQTKGPDWGTSNNYWMVSLLVIKIIILSHDQKMSLPIFFKKKVVMIFVTTRQSTVMVNSGETAHLSCSVQAIFFTTPFLNIIMTIPFLKIMMSNWPSPSSFSRLPWPGLPCLAGQCGEAQRDLEERGWRRSPAGRKVTFVKLADPWSLVLMTLMYSLYLIVGFYSILIPNSDLATLDSKAT